MGFRQAAAVSVPELQGVCMAYPIQVMGESARQIALRHLPGIRENATSWHRTVRGEIKVADRSHRIVINRLSWSMEYPRRTCPHSANISSSLRHHFFMNL